MSYGFQSKNFKIPAPQLADTLDETEERRAAEIVDTQLTGLAKTFSGGHGVAAEGSYLTSLNVDGTAKVVLTTYEGFINQVYTSATTVTWDNIPIGTFDLYVGRIEAGTNSSVQFGNVSAITTTQDLTAEALLMARVTNTGVSVSLNITPTGKTIIRTVSGHEAINLNPHGDTLFQETAIVSGLHVSGTASVANLSVSGSLTLLGPLIVSGTYAFDSLSADILSGTDADISDLTIRNSLTVQGDLTLAGALVVSGETTFTNNVTLPSGVSIDGIDPTTLITLISGVNADALHTHAITPPVGSVVSGANFVTAGRVFVGLTLETPKKDFEASVPQHVFDRVIRSGVGTLVFAVIDRIGVPTDFNRLHTQFTNIYIKGSKASGLGITGVVEGFDTAGQAIGLSGNDISPSNANVWQKFTPVVSGTGFTFTKGEFYTARYTISLATSGVAVYLGEANYPYMRNT